MGFTLLSFMFLFNVFAAIAGFMLIKKEKHVEYLLGAWAILTSVAVMAISTCKRLGSVGARAYP